MVPTMNLLEPWEPTLGRQVGTSRGFSHLPLYINCTKLVSNRVIFKKQLDFRNSFLEFKIITSNKEIKLLLASLDQLHCSKHFVCNVSFNLHNKPEECKAVLLVAKTVNNLPAMQETCV